MHDRQLTSCSFLSKLPHLPPQLPGLQTKPHTSASFLCHIQACTCHKHTFHTLLAHQIPWCPSAPPCHISCLLHTKGNTALKVFVLCKSSWENMVTYSCLFFLFGALWFKAGSLGERPQQEEAHVKLVIKVFKPTEGEEDFCGEGFVGAWLGRIRPQGVGSFMNNKLLRSWGKGRVIGRASMITLLGKHTAVPSLVYTKTEKGMSWGRVV